MTNDIALADRFSDYELFGMFNVECSFHGSRPGGEPVETDAVAVPLWKKTRRSVPKRHKQPGLEFDKVRENVTNHAPGTAGRLDDLRKFYSDATDERSAFAIEADEEK